MKKIEPYTGFEQGPIRPPSEAGSLLIRITRNCPWNRCTFCPVYKGTKFGLRPVEHVLKDIDKVKFYVEALLSAQGVDGRLPRRGHEMLFPAGDDMDRQALHAADSGDAPAGVGIDDANSSVEVHIEPHD